MRARRRVLVEMERLRIETRRERLDFFGGKDVSAELVALADANVFEELHGRLCVCGSAPARAASRPNIECTTKVISVRPEPLINSKRDLTKPKPGLLREVRVSSTVPRALMRSPGRSGASHLTSSTPGAPMKLVSASRLSLSMRMSAQQVCQPEAIRPPGNVARAACSSRCIGCGSNSAAKPTISSRLTRRDPQSKIWPELKSSQ